MTRFGSMLGCALLTCAPAIPAQAQAQAERAASAAAAATTATEVRITSDPGVVLAGTLRMPAAAARGPVPVAVMIQGHGPNGRGGFDVLGRRLLADGIAVLEYDKRGVRDSTGTYSEDAAALTRDATAAVAAMRARPDLDGARVALVGHSQGAAIAPAVAAADPRIAAVVGFAGPVGDGLELFGRSMRDRLLGDGRAPAAVEPAVAAATALMDARARGAAPAVVDPIRAAAVDGLAAIGFTPDQAEGAVAAIDRAEVWQIVNEHIASDLRALRVPVLALFAKLDPLVQASHAAAARAALAANPAGRVVVFDGMSHWFKDGAVTGTEAENATLGSNLGSPRAVALAGDWLRDVLVPATRPVAISAARPVR